MYNKLFTKILDSSIWLEDNPTRLIWITMIAAMDETGFVQFASIKNLAHRAIVSEDEAIKAVAKLEGQDPDSSDPENEGRRLEKVPGGWIVLNAEKYRAIVTREASKELNRIRVARHREKLKNVMKCNDKVMDSNHRVMESEAYTEAYTEEKNTHTSNSAEVNEVFSLYCSTWNKNPNTYKLTPERQKMIKHAISLYGKDGSIQAVHHFKNDPFEKRAQFNDLKYLFGKQERIDKWCGVQQRTSQVMNIAQKKHQENKERIDIVNQMIDSGAIK